MGVTIQNNNNSCDIGYAGFARFRTMVSKQCGEKFYKHYDELINNPLGCMGRTKEFFERYNKKTEQLIEEGCMTVEVANFCYQADCEGEIDQNQAKEIYELIKDCDPSTKYGYVGRDDCATMKDMQDIFKECAEDGGNITWW